MFLHRGSCPAAAGTELAGASSSSTRRKSFTSGIALLHSRDIAGSGFRPLSKIPHCCPPWESGPSLSPSVADHPKRPAKHRRLGQPLPDQLPNTTQAHQTALFSFLQDLARTVQQIPTRYAPICNTFLLPHWSQVPPPSILAASIKSRFLSSCPQPSMPIRQSVNVTSDFVGRGFGKMGAGLIGSRQVISTLPHLCSRIKQTENDIVQMFRLSTPKDESPNLPTSRALPRKNRSVRTLDERFIRILKIFKWGSDAEKALEVLMLKVDHRLVREVLKIDVEINVKMQFFRWAGKRRNFEHDSTTYMALIRCLDEAGLVGEMWKTIQEMVRGKCLISPTDLSDIVRILGKAKMVNKALSIFYQIKGRKCKPTASTYNSIILMLMQEGHHDKVYELYNEMCNEGNCFPDSVTYSALISTLGKLGREDSAIRLFDEMRENGFHPTARVYTTLMGIYFKLGRVEKALGLVQEMKEKGCPPTVYTYTEIIKGLGKAQRIDDAYSIFMNMLKEDCQPDVVLINNVINLLGRAGRLADAIKLFKDMESLHCTPNVVTYNSVIKALFECKAPTVEASSLFERMKSNGVIPSSFTYSILIDGFCKTNRVEKALLLLEEMDEKGFPPCPAAYCSLINTLGKAKRYEAANELFQELKENCGSSSARVYAVMIKQFGKCGRLTDAVDLFNEMKDLGCSPDVYTYNALMSGMVRGGMIDEAHSLLRTMEENGCVPDLNSHNIILNGFARTGGPQRAMEMLTKMKNSKMKPDAVSYNTVLGCLSRAGMFEEAAKLMKEMHLNGFEYDRITYSSILEAVGQIDEVGAHRTL